MAQGSPTTMQDGIETALDPPRTAQRCVGGMIPYAHLKERYRSESNRHCLKLAHGHSTLVPSDPSHLLSP
eukprot:6743168-Pyramimonas_sp.AAC.1